jgi:hypothetical protein
MSAREPDPDPSAAGYVFAIIEDRLRCDEALRDLVHLGLDGADIHTFVGAEGAAALSRARDPIAAAENGGFWTHLAHRLVGLSVSHDDAETYRAAADGGACVIAFPLDGSLEHARVTRMLESHAARFVRYYGHDGDTRTLLDPAARG